jgi:Ca2+-binding RTX toxin-like protein
MTQVDLGGNVRTAGQEDIFLSGVVDIDVFYGSDGAVVYTATRSGGAGLSSVSVTQAAITQTAFGVWPSDVQLGQDSALFRYTAGDEAYLAVTGVSAAGVWLYDLTADGDVPLRGHLPVGETLPTGLLHLQVLQPGGARRFLFGVEAGKSRILSWQLEEDGSLSGLRNQGTDLIAGTGGIVDLQVLEDRETPVLLALTGGTDILASFSVGASAKINLVDLHTQAEGLGISEPTVLRIMSVAQEDYAIVGARGSGTLTVFHISAAGRLTPVDHLMDSPDTRFGHITHLEVVELNGATYVLAAGDEDGISLFQLLPGGRLLHLSTLADTLETTLANVSAVAMAGYDDALSIAVTSEVEPGLTWIEVSMETQGETQLGGAGNDLLLGTSRDDVLSGQAGDDSLRAGGGDDVLMDGLGEDTLSGGTGVDGFVLSADGAYDEITDFQPGIDRLDLSNWAFLRNTGQLTILERTDGATLAFGEEVLRLITINGTSLSAEQLGAMDVLDGDRMLSSWLQSLSLLADAATGGSGQDSLTGTLARDVLDGGAGADTLLALAGDDRLDGGAGADVMNGGPGSDLFVVDDLGDQVIESRRWDGSDHVLSQVDFWLARAHIEDLTLTGSGNIRGVGNGLVNVLTGNEGDNILDGGKNNDTMLGGLGDDIYYVRAPQDTVIELPGEGTDIVRAYRSLQIPDEVEFLYLQGLAPINGVGNDVANVIIGNMDDNVIVGRNGRDTLKGQGGADTFVFDRAPGRNNVDRVVDFAPGEDVLWIKASLFGLERGPATGAMWHVGRTADEAQDRLLYDLDSGGLWVDPDGSGPEKAMLTFVLLNDVHLTPSDIVLF